MRRTPLAALLIVLLLGTYLRVYHLGAQSYWNDEGNSLRLAQRPALEVVRAAAADIHPPLYYLLLKPWHALAGDSEFALRFFSALAGVALAALLYRLGREYFGYGGGLGAAILGAIHPFLIYYSQEARMYALLAALSAASFLLFSRWLRSSRPPASPWGNRWLAAAYVLTTAAGLYTHYAVAFIVIAQNLAAVGGVLAHGRRRTNPPVAGGFSPPHKAGAPGGRARINPAATTARTDSPVAGGSSPAHPAGAPGGRAGINPAATPVRRDSPVAGGFSPPHPAGAHGGSAGINPAATITKGPAATNAVQTRLLAWLLLQALTLLLFLPWLPAALRQITTWPADRSALPFLGQLADLVRYLLFGRTLPTLEAIWGMLGAALLFVFALRRRGQTITPLLWLLVPVALTLALGLLTEPFSKFLLAAVPALCVLLGNGLAAIPVRAGPDDLPAWLLPRRQRIVEALRLAVWLAGLAGLVIATYFSLNNLYFNPAYARDDYRAIARRVADDARAGDAVILISPNQWEAYSYYHASPAPAYPLPRARPLDVAATVAELESIALAHSRLFVLFWGEAQADPAQVVEGWLNAHAFKAEDTWYGGVRLAVYAAAQPAPAPEVRVDSRFGEHIVLEGYAVRPAAPVPGDILQVTLFWRTEAPLEERYKVFVHVYAGLDAPPVAQQDGEPGGGLRLTPDWPPGEAIPDNHGVPLPPELPPGEYEVRVGLYNTFTTLRLPITLDGQPAGDSLPAGTITVVD